MTFSTKKGRKFLTHLSAFLSYIQQQNNIISWEEDVMATTIALIDDNGDEVFSEEVEGRTSVTIPECIKGEYDLVLYIQSKEYIGRIEL